MRNFTSWTHRRWAIFTGVTAMVAIIVLVPWRLVAQERARSEALARATAGAHSSESPKFHQPSSGPSSGQSGENAQSPDALHAIIQLPGDISAPTYWIGSPVEGVIQDVSVKEGESVKKGQTLIRFDDTEVAAAYKQAAARLDLRKTEWDKYQNAAARGTVSSTEVAAAKARLQEAEAGMTVAGAALERTGIKTPVDGVVVAVMNSAGPGQFVKKGDNLLMIVDPSRLSVRCSVPEPYSRSLKVGDKVRVFRSGSHEPHPAVISFISPLVQNNSVEIHAALAAPDRQLKSGLRVTVELSAAEPAKE